MFPASPRLSYTWASRALTAPPCRWGHRSRLPLLRAAGSCRQSKPRHLGLPWWCHHWQLQPLGDGRSQRLRGPHCSVVSEWCHPRSISPWGLRSLGHLCPTPHRALARWTPRWSPPPTRRLALGSLGPPWFTRTFPVLDWASSDRKVFSTVVMWRVSFILTFSGC